MFLPGEEDAPSTFVLPEWLQHLLPDEVLGRLEHPWIFAGAIVIASLVIAKLVDWLTTGILLRAVRRTSSSLDDEVVAKLHGPIIKTVILAGLWIASSVLPLEAATLVWIHRLIATLILVVWAAGSLRILDLVLRLMSGQGARFHAVEPRTLPLFSNLGKLVLLAFAAYLLIEVWDLNPTGWLASAGVAGIALGFAAKDTLANLFAGVFIIADGPYQVGDYVNLESGYRGRVQQIGLRSTRILTRDDVEITVPNSVIGNGAIVNESSGAPRYRVRLKVGVAYGTDIDRVREVLNDVSRKMDATMNEPAPRVRFRSFGGSSLDFELLTWIREPERRGRVLDALHCEVYKRFSDAGIEIAYPQQDLHVRTVPESWKPAD